MPNPIGGAYPIPGDLGQRLAGVEKAIAQLQRLMTQPPKTPKPPVGGGIVDVASVYTSGTVGLPWPSGASDVSYSSASYSVESHTGDMSWLSITGGDIAVTQDGFYSAWCYVDLRWSSQAEAPGASISLYLNGNGTAAGGLYYPIIKAGLLWGVVVPVSFGDEWMTAGQYWRLEADADGTSSAGIARSGASWRITRYA